MNKIIFDKQLESYLENKFSFNRFGLINLKVLRLNIKTDLTDEKLKEVINNRFAKEMVDGKIEFI